MDITRLNRYQVRAQVDMDKSHLIQWAGDTLWVLNDLHRFESDAEHLESIDSLLADNTYRFRVAEHGEGGARIPNPMQRELKATYESLAST